MPESSGKYADPVWVEPWGWLNLAPRQDGMTINETVKVMEKEYWDRKHCIGPGFDPVEPKPINKEKDTKGKR